MTLLSKIHNKLYPSGYPLWIRVLNCGSLSGLIVYPLVALATYARLGDYERFYQPTRGEYVMIYTYPLLLMLISYCSYQIFKSSKILAAIPPIIVIIYYFYLLQSGTLFELPGTQSIP